MKLRPDMTAAEAIQALADDAPGCRFVLEMAFSLAGFRLLIYLDDLGLRGADIQNLYADVGYDTALFVAEIEIRATSPRLDGKEN